MAKANFPYFAMLSMFSILFAAFAMGVIFVAIGLKGVLMKRPILIQLKHMAWPLLLSLSLAGVLLLADLLTNLFRAFLYPDVALPVDLSIAGIILMFAGMLTVMFIIVWKELDGYTVLGVTEGALREGLLHTLRELDIPFQEVMLGIRLAELDAHISASTTAWIGSTQLRIKPREHGHLLRAVGEALKQYYRNTAIQVNRSAFLWLILSGLFLLFFPLVYIILTLL